MAQDISATFYIATMAQYQAYIEVDTGDIDQAGLREIQDQLDDLLQSCLDDANKGILYGSSIMPDDRPVIIKR